MIDFDLNSIRALVFDIDGVLSTDVMDLSETGDPVRTVNVKDGYSLQLAVKKGLKVGIITGARVQSLRKRFLALGIPDEDIYIASKVKIHDWDDFLKRNGLQAGQVLYMGDDIPDYEIMQVCGLPCCPADACPEIQALARYISPRDGGRGCVRDVVEQVMKVQGLWLSDRHAFGW